MKFWLFPTVGSLDSVASAPNWVGSCPLALVDLLVQNRNQYVGLD